MPADNFEALVEHIATSAQGHYITSIEFILDIFDTIGSLHQRGLMDKNLA